MKNYSRLSHGKVIRLSRRDLPANREDKPGINREIRSQEFGIYRPLHESSVRKLAATAYRGLGLVVEDITNERGGEDRIAEFNVKNSMATTFVQRNDIGRRRLEMLRTGFRLRYKIDELHEQLYNPEEQTLTVGLNIDHFEWTDRTKRSLAVFFDTTNDGYEKLLHERDIIENLLGAYSCKLAEVVRTPTHITLLTYGKSGDQLDLNKAHKNEIIEQFQDSFEDERIFSVDLKPLNIGETYENPTLLWSRAAERSRSRMRSAS